MKPAFDENKAMEVNRCRFLIVCLYLLEIYMYVKVIYVICVCLCIVVSNTYCVVYLLCFSSSCVSYVAISGMCIFDCPFGIL
jgi:hypothetical protein